MSANIPEQMKAMAIDEYGGPEKLTLHTLPVPPIDDNEVLVKVAVAGVGVWDPLEREGKLIMGEARFPRILGGDGAGTVVAVGKDVTDFAEGDRVYGFGFQNPKGGFYAEYIVVPTEQITKTPEKLSTEEAGAMPVDAVTGLTGLNLLNIGEGQTLLIWGASGGIGHLMVQLAKRMEARVFAVASGQDGVEFVQSLGADETVDGRGSDVLAKAKAFAPEGFDSALILSNGSQAVLETVRQGGQIVYPHGVMPEPEAPAGVRSQAFDGRPSPEIYEKLNQLIEAGPFEVKIARTYTLEEAAQAQEDLKGHLLGKVILNVSSGS